MSRLEISRGDVLPPRMFGPFSTVAVAAYAEASGDHNPLHVDPTIAARAGLARPPVHGMLVMACFEPFLAAWRSDLVVLRLDGKFIKPLLIDEPVELTGKVVQAAPGQPAVLRLTAKNARGDLVCLAEATVRS